MQNALAKITIGLGVMALAASGCNAPESSERVGTASVRIEVGDPNGGGGIDRVVVRASNGLETDLTPDYSGAFVGTLLLPSGTHELTGQAFSRPRAGR